MRILLIGKHKMVTEFIETHIHYQEPQAETTALTPWELAQIKGTYNLIILDNLSLTENLEQALMSLAPYVEKEEDIILLNTPVFAKPEDRYTSLNPSGSAEELNEILRKASGRKKQKNTLNVEDFLTRFTLACKNRETLRKLTTRQIHIIQLILSGMSYQQTADQLNVSINAIKKHMSLAYKKIGIKGKGELYQIFRNERHISPPSTRRIS